MEPRLQRITSVTTKVRRLGYFTRFSQILKQNSLTQTALKNQILSEKDDNKKLLTEACCELPISRKDVTGEIANSDAFERYLGTAKELGLIENISGRLYSTKRGEVLAELVGKQNFFKLTLPQIHLIWHIILEKDYDYIRNVIVCTIDSPRNEDQAFFKNVKDLWHRKLNEAILRKVEDRDNLRKAVETKWRSPIRYYRENIKSPRLEWLLDLNAIEFWNFEKKHITFRPNIMCLIESEPKQFSASFLSFMEPTLPISKRYWNDLPKTMKYGLIKKLVSDSFTLFAFRKETRKISANEFLEFGVSFLAGSGIVCEIQELEESLFEFTSLKGSEHSYSRISSSADSGYITEY